MGATPTASITARRGRAFRGLLTRGVLTHFVRFAFAAQLLASHWYYLFMSLHIGLHVGMIANTIKQKRNAVDNSSARKIICRILLALACAYGIYAFITHGVWKYLILRQQFFFFDFERGYVLFALDYISIIILFAAISHLIASRLKKNR